jgi:hypothetical protein
MKPADELTLWLGATRYYMGRMTYAVSSFCELLIEQWPALNEDTRYLIQRDLEREFAKDDEMRQQKSQFLPLGQDCDRAEWERVRRLWQ